MSLEADRETATRLLKTLADGQIDLTALAENAVWWVPGRPEMPLEQFKAGFKVFQDLIAPGGRMEIHGMTAEGNRLAIEAESIFPTKDGRTYNNTYHFLMEFRDGKVIRVKEYCNTAYVQQFFGG